MLLLKCSINYGAVIFRGEINTMNNPQHKLEPLIVSRLTASRMLDCSVCHIDDLTDKGQLERVPLGVRRVGITMESLKRISGAT